MVTTPATFPVVEFDLPWFDGTTHHFIYGMVKVEGLTPNEGLTVVAQEILPGGNDGLTSTWPEALGDHVDENGVWEHPVQLTDAKSTIQVTGSHDAFTFTAAPVE